MSRIFVNVLNQKRQFRLQVEQKMICTGTAISILFVRAVRCFFYFARESPRAIDCDLNKTNPEPLFTCLQVILIKAVFSRYTIYFFGFLAILSEKLLKIYGIVELFFLVCQTICLRLL